MVKVTKKQLKQAIELADDVYKYVSACRDKSADMATLVALSKARRLWFLLRGCEVRSRGEEMNRAIGLIQDAAIVIDDLLYEAKGEQYRDIECAHHWLSDAVKEIEDVL